MKTKSKNKLLSGAVIISLGGFLTKIIGAFYRIPLTNILGADGIGLYQMAFPVYCMLLTFSSTGVPGAIAKLTAEREGDKSVLKGALTIFIPIGLICTLIMSLFSSGIAKLQGNVNASGCYLLLAPSVFFVSIICCFRGYYQGLSDMLPTALSQVIEQVVKLIIGLSLCLAFSGEPIKGAASASLAVSVSELFAVVYFLILGKYKKVNVIKIEGKPPYRKIILTVLPIMLSTLILPLTRTIESFFVINIMLDYTESATSLYGIYSGGVESLVGVPVSVCYGVAVTVIPIISELTAKGEDTSKRVKQALIYTVVLATFFALCFLIFGNLAVDLLYGKLSVEEGEIMKKLVKLSSLSVFLLPLMQTTASILIAKGKLLKPPTSSAIACAVKLILSAFLLSFESINVFALVISDIVAYFLASFINLLYIIKYKKRN